MRNYVPVSAHLPFIYFVVTVLEHSDLLNTNCVVETLFKANKLLHSSDIFSLKRLSRTLHIKIIKA